MKMWGRIYSERGAIRKPIPPDPQWGASQQAKMDQPVANISPTPPLTRSKTPRVIYCLFASNLSTRRIRLFRLFI